MTRNPTNYGMLLGARFFLMSNGARSAMTVARFDPSGKHIFIGTAAGSVLVFNTRTKIVSLHSLISSAFANRNVLRWLLVTKSWALAG
jgi:hypothetical protein